jgi:hypothetical protein
MRWSAKIVVLGVGLVAVLWALAQVPVNYPVELLGITAIAVGALAMGNRAVKPAPVMIRFGRRPAHASHSRPG